MAFTSRSLFLLKMMFFLNQGLVWYPLIFILKFEFDTSVILMNHFEDRFFERYYEKKN